MISFSYGLINFKILYTFKFLFSKIILKGNLKQRDFNVILNRKVWEVQSKKLNPVKKSSFLRTIHQKF